MSFNKGDTIKGNTGILTLRPSFIISHTGGNQFDEVYNIYVTLSERELRKSVYENIASEKFHYNPNNKHHNIYIAKILLTERA